MGEGQDSSPALMYGLRASSSTCFKGKRKQGKKVEANISLIMFIFHAFLKFCFVQTRSYSPAQGELEFAG